MNIFTFLLLIYNKRSYRLDKWQIQIKQEGGCGVNYFLFTFKLERGRKKERDRKLNSLFKLYVHSTKAMNIA